MFHSLKMLQANFKHNLPISLPMHIPLFVVAVVVVTKQAYMYKKNM